MEKDYAEFESYRDNDNEGFKEMQASIFDAITLVGQGAGSVTDAWLFRVVHILCSINATIELLKHSEDGR